MSWHDDELQARRSWRGPIERYDLLKEGALAVVVIGIILVLLTTFLGSPRIASVSFQTWAQNAPDDFVATTLTELAGTSESATYGPPYNHGTAQVQNLVGNFSVQTLGGVSLPVNPPEDFVLKPLRAWSALSPALAGAVKLWDSASPEERAAWLKNAAAAKITIAGDRVTWAGENAAGPVPVFLNHMLAAARAGAMDSQLINNPSAAYSMDYTKSLLYLADGNYLGDIAGKYSLKGETWGVMNEIGSWPGQPWLWFYTIFYQIPPWSTIGTDIIVIATVVPLITIVMFLPWIPGLRSLPRLLGIYRWIWRDYYRRKDSGSR